MIEDLDGATTEPSRRTHVAVLSASVAAVSLVLLYVLLVPATLMDTRQLAASPAPSPTNRTVVMFASGPGWVRSGQVSQIREVVTMTPCFIAFGSNPPAQPDYWGEIVFTLPCDTPDASARRINRAR